MWVLPDFNQSNQVNSSFVGIIVGSTIELISTQNNYQQSINSNITNWSDIWKMGSSPWLIVLCHITKIRHLGPETRSLPSPDVNANILYIESIRSTNLPRLELEGTTASNIQHLNLKVRPEHLTRRGRSINHMITGMIQVRVTITVRLGVNVEVHMCNLMLLRSSPGVDPLTLELEVSTHVQCLSIDCSCAQVLLPTHICILKPWGVT